MIKIGIIGGSGLNDPNILKEPKEILVKTPYGDPTSPLTCGKINNRDVVIIARHGKNHQFSPSQVNYRANLFALREQGVSHIIATTACGSLKKEIGRGHFIILDQFIDFTRIRENSYHRDFSNGAVHTPMADPFDNHLRQVLYGAAKDLGYAVHEKGTVVTIEGPRFSTRAESKMFINWGADVINMSVATEAILANELKMPYGVIGMSTDYDCWKEDEEPVSWEEILKTFNKNVESVKNILVKAISEVGIDQINQPKL